MRRLIPAGWYDKPGALKLLWKLWAALAACNAVITVMALIGRFEFWVVLAVVGGFGWVFFGLAAVMASIVYREASSRSRDEGGVPAAS